MENIYYIQAMRSFEQRLGYLGDRKSFGESS